MFRRLLKLAVSLLYFVFLLLPASVFSWLSGRAGRSTVILCYHGVHRNHREAFAWQMAEVLKAGQPVSLTELGCIDGPIRAIAITFDDAFANLIENALPELRKRAMPATVFIPSGNLGRTPDWRIGERSVDASERLMTAEEVRAAVATGLVTIGSHTVSHRALTGLHASDLDHELRASRVDLEKLTGHSVETIAFPCGVHDERVLVHTRRAGYTRAFTIEPTVHRADGDEFLMGRVRVEPDDWPLEVWLKLRGGYQWLALARRLRPDRGGPAL